MNDIKRRAFIRNTILTGAGLSLTVPELLHAQADLAYENKPNPLTINNISSKKIIVAGAGISGLCCAYELMKAGHEVVVLEASGRHGGHVFTGRDGLSDGLYADYGADHITKPGYEKFFDYTREFNLTVLPYRQRSEGSLIKGKFYNEAQLRDPIVLKSLGFNEMEIKLLSKNPWWSLESFYLESYISKFTDAWQPYGVGLDDLDQISISALYKKQGASEMAIDWLGGNNTSALYKVWRFAVMGFRGIPHSEGDVFRLKGGNQEMTNMFAKKLGARVKLGSPVSTIEQTEMGITVTYKEYGYDEEKRVTADFLVNAISFPVFKKIPVKPVLTPEKQFVVDNLSYTSHPHYVFEASSKFWLEDGFQTINMEFDHPDIQATWQTADEVETERVIIIAYGPSGLSPQRVLAAFRKVYPGKKDTIVQAITKDWSKDNFAPTCEMMPFPVGQMHRFWPQVVKPEGRIYFVGTYADNLSRGMESCLRSANRVAEEINGRA